MKIFLKILIVLLFATISCKKDSKITVLPASVQTQQKTSSSVTRDTTVMIINPHSTRDYKIKTFQSLLIPYVTGTYTLDVDSNGFADFAIDYTNLDTNNYSFSTRRLKTMAPDCFIYTDSIYSISCAHYWTGNPATTNEDSLYPSPFHLGDTVNLKKRNTQGNFLLTYYKSTGAIPGNALICADNAWRNRDQTFVAIKIGNKAGWIELGNNGARIYGYAIAK